MEESAPPVGGGKVVLSVELLWLRWSFDPINIGLYEDDYSSSGEIGARRFFEDLDSVGEGYIHTINSADLLAKHLIELDRYPNPSERGGGATSNNPYIYAAILFALQGALKECGNALNIGFQKYQTTVSSPEWKIYRLEQFNKQAELIRSAYL
ncbi:hypothetical protein N8I74_12755 [Chitiniphilus purpureus]|uniref:Uncharacterized protein n=1 Tax=Chitiniphilus purpureus TaxID=2981137 RepID=A0ABY6DIN5_9NEIS|nr:hypothetical protein [Chitiniphilus sp. CD1]UXY14187.1 hypothetical protein N8I74_12755 [Chitiniphilus sp. CD1]